MEKNNPSISQISDWLEGKLSKEETKAVEHWLFSHWDDRECRTKMFSVWSRVMEKYPDASGKEKSWGMFEARMRKERRRQRNERFVRILVRTAACLFIPLAAGIVWMYLSDDKETVWTERYVAYGQTDSLVLPDGSSIYMNSGSRIIYDSSFKGRNRQVFVSGEAFFDVAPDKNRPFIVQVDDITVKVLGTRFNVRHYDNDEYARVVLYEGAVEFGLAGNPDPICSMTPGDEIRYNIESGAVTEHRFDVSESGLWTDGALVFNDERLEDIAESLERRFDVHISVLDRTLADTRYYMNFINGESLHQILAFLRNDMHLNVHEGDGVVQIW